MATPTYTPIASITLGSSQNSVEFTSIPQDYRDLVLVIDAAVSTVGALAGEMYFNSDTNSGNYSTVAMTGGADGSTSSSSSSSSTQVIFDADGGLNILQIMDYSATDKHKTTLIRTNSPLDRVEARATRWANSSAITSVEITDQSQTFDTGSTFALYGIEA